MNVYRYEGYYDPQDETYYATVVANSRKEADKLINDEIVYKELGVEWELMYFGNDIKPQVLSIGN